MTTAHECQWCKAEVHAGTNLCARCVTTLDKALPNIAVYFNDLENLRTKRTRYGDGVATRGSVGKTQPLPLDGRFTDRAGSGSTLAADVRNTVTTWVRVLLEGYPPLEGPTCTACLHRSCHEVKRRAHPRDTVASCCAYLGAWRSIIAAEDWAADFLRDMLDLETRLRRMVDRPPDAWYAGVCGSVTPMDDGTEVTCTRELYAVPGSPWVQCRDCGCTYDVEARRKALLKEAEDREVTVRVLARIVTTLGAVDVSEARIESRINVWVTRKRLTSHGSRVVDGRKRPVYRVGDVLDLLAQDSNDDKRKGTA